MMWKRVLILLSALLLILLGWNYLPVKDWSIRFVLLAEEWGWRGILIFVTVYVLATLVLFPCAFFTFAAGLAYGLWGFPLVLFSTCIGSGMAFLLSRYAFRKQVEEYLNRRVKTKAFKKAIESEGWKFMLLLRISPIIPFNLNNYLLGSVRVSFLSYITATLLGAVPGTLVYVYLGMMGRDVNETHWAKWVFLALGLLATLFLTHMTLKKTKFILQQNEFAPANML